MCCLNTYRRTWPAETRLCHLIVVHLAQLPFSLLLKQVLSGQGWYPSIALAGQAIQAAISQQVPAPQKACYEILFYQITLARRKNGKSQERKRCM